MEKVGLELDKAFNIHYDKTREGQRGMCMACVHDVTDNHTRRNGNLKRRISRNPVRCSTGHNSPMLGGQWVQHVLEVNPNNSFTKN